MKFATLNDVNAEFELFLKTLDKEIYDKELISKAYEFAKKAHAFQRRRSGEPYIMHPVEVAKIVASFGMDNASIMAALLHDTVEDTEVTLEDVTKEFSEEIALLVDGLSKITQFGDRKKTVDFDEHISSLRKILLASAKDIRILIIKLCDRLHNMRTLKELPEAKRIKKSRETMQIYVPIAQKIGIYALKWELEDLSFKFLDPEMFQEIKKRVGLKREEREAIVKESVDDLKEKLGVGSEVIMLGRPKNFYSIYKKIKNKSKEFEDIYDLYAIRIICNTVSECYTILGRCHEQFRIFPNRLKDYIATPKANGYQSIHTVIYSDAIKSPVELQIRTEDMNKLAEFGIAAHWKYKNLKEDKKFEQKISWLREVLQWEKEHEDNQEFLKLLKFDFFEDEIFVFTPKNKVITLPEKATALDFAYAVHTEIGDRAYKCKINGSVYTIDTVLKSGDIVEIITNPSSKPNEKWLKFVKTSRARLKIRDSLDLKLKKSLKLSKETLSTEDLIKKIARIDSHKNVKTAGCCTFEYGEQIVGVYSKDKKLVIHNASCPNAKFAINKKIPLRWIEEREKEVTLYLNFTDRHGLVVDLLTIFSNYNANCTKMNTKVSKNGLVTMTVKLIDGDFVEKMVEDIKELESLENIKIARGLLENLKA
ncbi:MAG: RelA/SpoT family protein [Nanoarchaeota archaeon]|nr:RelA/SpoT family protein [Nanoarchaeota archaeon]